MRPKVKANADYQKMIPLLYKGKTAASAGFHQTDSHKEALQVLKAGGALVVGISRPGDTYRPFHYVTVFAPDPKKPLRLMTVDPLQGLSSDGVYGTRFYGLSKNTDYHWKGIQIHGPFAYFYDKKGAGKPAANALPVQHESP